MTAKDGIPWVLTLIFAAGGFVASTRASSAQTERVQHQLEEHMAQPGHPVELERIKKLEQDQVVGAQALQRLESELQRANENLVAVCQATRGAQCVR